MNLSKSLLFLALASSLCLFSGCTDVAVIDLPTYEDTGIIGIDWEHYKTHEGEHFFYRDFVTLGNNANQSILLRTGNCSVHIIMQFYSDNGAFNVSLWEYPTTSNNGTHVNYWNSNRNFTNINCLNITISPTLSTFGTMLFKEQAGSGTKVGGDIRGRNEIILNANSIYLVRITNVATTSNDINYHFDWYDEE